MSHQVFQDDCPGCAPAIVDVHTGRPLADDTPEMVAVNKMWATDTTLEERSAFHEVTCKNSRDPRVLAIAHKLVDKITKTLESLGGAASSN